MLRRLCLYLLVACLALPAVAAPLHCAPTPAVEMPAHHRHSEPQKAPGGEVSQHDCIGCIASFAVSDAPAKADLPPISREKPHNDLLLTRAASGPDTPPPRA